MKKFILPAMLITLICSCTCNDTARYKPVIPQVDNDKLPEVNITIKRYEKALFTIDRNNFSKELKLIQPDFAIFLDGDLDDPANLIQLNAYIEDPVIQDNYKECIKQYPDLKDIESELNSALQLYKYHFADKQIPQIYTYVSGGDFEKPIKFGDSVLIIALDLYLGGNYFFYSSCGLPKYKVVNMDRKYLVRDCMEEIGISVCEADSKKSTLLDQMINMGKVMYFLDLTLPEVHDTVKIKYSSRQLDWCFKNEGRIWAFFIDNKLLYSKNRDILLKYFLDGPFTQSFGKESPPRIAIWVGWQIIRNYMKTNENTEIEKLLADQDSQKILTESKYKPKK